MYSAGGIFKCIFVNAQILQSLHWYMFLTVQQINLSIGSGNGFPQKYHRLLGLEINVLIHRYLNKTVNISHTEFSIALS